MKCATLNVTTLARSLTAILEHFVQDELTVICVQETRLPEYGIPAVQSACRKAGCHIHLTTTASTNGVPYAGCAVLSSLPLVPQKLPCEIPAHRVAKCLVDSQPLLLFGVCIFHMTLPHGVPLFVRSWMILLVTIQADPTSCSVT